MFICQMYLKKFSLVTLIFLNKQRKKAIFKSSQHVTLFLRKKGIRMFVIRNVSISKKANEHNSLK